MAINKDRGAKLRFGLIGAGRIAESYGQAFQASGNAQLAGIADTRPNAAKDLAQRFACDHYDSHLKLADSKAIDAMVVATPPSTHPSICLDLLERGIAVLCEKPVSIDPESARLIQKKSREKKVPFTMASKFRYVDDVVRARNIVESGILGDIVLFENTFMSYVDMSGRWNTDRAVSGGGVLIDNGTHSVDIMRYFIGPLASIHAVAGPQIQGLPVEETAHVTARSESGAVGRMDLSWSINKQCDDYIAIYGSKGTLRVGWKASLYKQAGNSNWIQFGNGYNKVQAFRDQIQNFSAAVQGLERLLIDASDAVASVDGVYAGYAALKTGSWVDISTTGAAAAASCAA
ncbi:MAG TPA: Gfo/Idh/MocA family oxidoreductase [Bryobacteraceae bacterium]